LVGSSNTKPNLRIPGFNICAYLMLPLRVLVWGMAFMFLYLLLLPISMLRAIYLRLVVGPPSKILVKGTRPIQNHQPGGGNYLSQMLFSQPFDATKLKAALISAAGDDNIKEHEVELTVMDEVPRDWPVEGSYGGSCGADYFIPKTLEKYYNPVLFGLAKVSKTAKVHWHLFNGAAGKPTVIIYHGSGMGWDGSSNFNFAREVVCRYLGQKNDVFQKPEMDPESAKVFDRASFCRLLCVQPYNLARSLGGMLWNLVRAAKWAGGNGICPHMVVMNFDKEDSLKLYQGCKALGATPFAAFTHAAVKAAREVLGEAPANIVQQASLQTRHFPVASQGNRRDFVGDWLVGPVQYVTGDYSLVDAQKGVVALREELKGPGPAVCRSFMAKAYGLVNSGAATFEVFPTFNDDAHIMSKCLFMNNYGVRDMPEGSNFVAWNWNAPMWLGVNTICVDGRTTTMVGSSFWGLEVVDALRNNIEATLRGIMSHADKQSSYAMPSHSKPS